MPTHPGAFAPRSIGTSLARPVAFVTIALTFALALAFSFPLTLSLTLTFSLAFPLSFALPLALAFALAFPLPFALPGLLPLTRLLTFARTQSGLRERESRFGLCKSSLSRLRLRLRVGRIACIRLGSRVGQ